MIYLQLYFLFSLTTAIAAQYELVNPVMRTQRQETGEPVENEYMIVMASFLINILLAPLVFLSCIIPTWGARFRDTFQKALFEQE